MALFWSARLLFLRKNSPACELVFVLQWLTNFEKKFPPCTALFWSACLMFFKNFLICTFISSYMSIRYTVMFSEIHAFCSLYLTIFSGNHAGLKCLYLETGPPRLKVSISQKQIMASWILPKNECWGNFQYTKLPQCSFFGRIQDNIYIFFEIFWPLLQKQTIPHLKTLNLSF